MTNSINTPSLKKLLISPFVPILLDVRRKADYMASPKKISSAVWRDPEMIKDWSTELSVGRKIVAYCAKGGSVSQSVVERLAREGHAVAYLEGGIKAWVDSGEPVE